MAAADHYDVIIIGSGAGGGTLAYRLAPSGKRVLLLERGGYLPRERDNWETEAVFLRGKYLTTEQWLDVDGEKFTPEQNYNVGGNTKFYGAALFRLRPEDFGDIQHHGGLSPAWPITYDELEPFYGEAEELYVVHGADGEDPTDGPRSTPYPNPPVKHEPRIQQLSDDLEALGLHPSHLPIGVMLDQDDAGDPLHGSRCIRCDRVDGFPCLVEGKADSQVVCVDPALAHSERRPGDPRQGRAPGDRRHRSPGDGGRRHARRRLGGPLLRRHRRRLLRRPRTRRCCCCARRTTATPTVWRTARTRWAATTCGTTTWR